MNPSSATLIDYGAGNIRSVLGALSFLNQNYQITSNPETVSGARCLILPGVGSFGSAMDSILAQGLDEAIRVAIADGAYILGICLGMQLLGEGSEEDGGREGLRVVPGVCERFHTKNQRSIRIPHMGYNSVAWSDNNPLFDRVPTHGDFYFVHSYRFSNASALHEHPIATTDYGGDFISAYAIEGRICGTQFHPELSQGNGLLVLRNFLRLSQC